MTVTRYPPPPMSSFDAGAGAAAADEEAGAAVGSGAGASSFRHATKKNPPATRAADASAKRDFIRPIDHSPCPVVQICGRRRIISAIRRARALESPPSPSPGGDVAILRPFRALRPVPQRARDVAAVPYDVVSTEEARSLGSGNPWSFLHVSRAEIDLPEGTDPYSADVYRKAAENFERLTRECPLIRESEPSLYLYRLRMGDRQQIGVA